MKDDFDLTAGQRGGGEVRHFELCLFALRGFEREDGFRQRSDSEVGWAKMFRQGRLVISEATRVTDENDETRTS